MNWRSLVYVGHAEALSDVETEYAEQGDYEEERHTWSEEECNVDNSEDVAVLEGDNEEAARIEISKLLDRLAPALPWVSR